MFSVEVLEDVAVIVTFVPEFSVIVVCDVDNVIDGGVGVLTTEAAVPPPPPQPARVENTREMKRSLISFIGKTLSIVYPEL